MCASSVSTLPNAVVNTQTTSVGKWTVKPELNDLSSTTCTHFNVLYPFLQFCKRGFKSNVYSFHIKHLESNSILYVALGIKIKPKYFK